MITHPPSLTPMTTPTERDPRWAAVVARDAAADGAFYYSVASTGVYCFPSCAARLANPGNVRFHETREEAEKAGFRPCKRCRPDAGGGTRQRAARPLDVAIGESSIGLVLVAESDAGLSAVLIGDDRESLRRELRERFPAAVITDGEHAPSLLAERVIAHVDAPARPLDVTLDLRGTEFQRRVWLALREIPAGTTASYTDIARRIGRPGAVRGVARACAANALAVVVPCHRVVRRNGELSGYRWGVHRKRTLLAKEASA